MKKLFMVSFLFGVLVAFGQACSSNANPSIISGTQYDSNGNPIYPSTTTPGSVAASGLQVSQINGVWSACSLINDPTYGQYYQGQKLQITGSSINTDGSSTASVTLTNTAAYDSACSQIASQGSSSGTIQLIPQAGSLSTAQVNMILNGVGNYTVVQFNGSNVLYFGATSSSASSRPAQVNTSIPFNKTN